MSEIRIGKWVISYDPPPIPVRTEDYVAVHDDYDGAPTYGDEASSDPRCLRGRSVQDVIEEIDALEEGEIKRRYKFAVTLAGEGTSMKEAWDNAVLAFMEDPGEGTVLSAEDIKEG